jgi:drug/metabolite transporter (DMT)-like permease
MTSRAQRRYGLGALSGVASAILFGLSAPVAKFLLPGSSPWLLAGLLYLGAGLGLSILRLATHARGSADADRLRREDFPT